MGLLDDPESYVLEGSCERRMHEVVYYSKVGC
jgi:hypothetical protein